MAGRFRKFADDESGIATTEVTVVLAASLAMALAVSTMLADNLEGATEGVATMLSTTTVAPL